MFGKTCRPTPYDSLRNTEADYLAVTFKFTPLNFNNIREGGTRFLLRFSPGKLHNR